MADGTSCGSGFICFSEVCVPSRCGDGFVDVSGGEECDDGNEVPGDGCEPATCTFSCADDLACDDAFPCNGGETCNTALHRCQAGTPEDGVACMLDDGSTGSCSGGLCASPGCGNSVVDTGEDCDDGQNGDNDDGCRDDCTFTCADDTGCTDGDACNGDETCDATAHTCSAGTAPDCDDSDACTADACDAAMGCASTLIDADMDSYSPMTCGSGSSHMGGDCNDANSAIYPGAPELCDSMDNDCDMMVDDMTVTVTCYRDTDMDGYGLMTSTMMACTCPAGYVPPRADGDFDCRDSGTGAGSVNPGVTAWYSVPYCTTAPGGRPCSLTPFDYNCDGVQTQRYLTVSAGCTTLLGRCSGSGWTTTVPACGATGTYRTCIASRTGLCTSSTATRAQECH